MSRRFLVVWFGQIVSQFGTALSGFGAAVWVFVETGSFAWLAVLTVAVSLPPLLVVPVLRFIDVFDRRRVMIVADTGAALATTAVVAVWATGDLEAWHLVVASVAGGLFGSVQAPAYAAAIPSLVEPEGLDRANGLVQLGPALSLVAAPGLAGLLIAGPGIGSVLAVDLVTFTVAVGTVVVTRFQATASPAPGDSRSVGSAVRWLWSQARPISYLIGAIAAVNFMLAVFNLAVLARGTALGGEAAAGLAPAVGGVGMILTSLVLGAKGTPKRRMETVGLATAVFGVVTMASVAAPSLALLVICVGLAMSSGPLVQTIIATTLQERVPPGMQGRVFGLRNAIGRGSYPLGAAAAGIIASWSQTGAMITTGAVLVLIGTATTLSHQLRALNPQPATA
ncbi:MAG: MFS transporter [Actinomycetota bacterium]